MERLNSAGETIMNTTIPRMILLKFSPRWLGLWITLWVGWTERAIAQDTTPPQLVAVTPANEATGIAREAPLQLTFDEAMKPQASVLWITFPVTIVDTRVKYVWSADGKAVSCTYPGGWPKGQTIAWVAQPTSEGFPPFLPAVVGFEDLAGNPLESGDHSNGQFSVVNSGGGTVGPTTISTNSCGVITTNLPENLIFLSVSSTYNQTNSGVPTPQFGVDGTEEPFSFSAVAFLMGGGSASEVKLGLPSGSQLTISNRFGSSFYLDSTNSIAALQSKYPGGNYRFLLRDPVGLPGEIDVNLSSRVLPIIHVSNYAEAQVVNSAEAFTLRWDPLNGLATEPLTVTIGSENGGDTVFESPDFECPLSLNCTSTAVTIPARKLSANTRYRVTVSVVKAFTFTQINSSTRAGASKLTSTILGLQTLGGGGTVVPFTVEAIDVVGSGPNLFRVHPAVPKRTYLLQFRSTLGDATPWTQVASATATAATLDLNHTGFGSTGFYRVLGQ